MNIDDFKKRYRILHNGYLYKVQRKGMLWGWNTVKRYTNSDDVFDVEEMVFQSFESASKFINSKALEEIKLNKNWSVADE